MSRALALIALLVLCVAVPQGTAAAPSPFRAAVTLSSGAGALTSADEVTAILTNATADALAPTAVSFDLAAREDGTVYRATGRITCWSTLAQRRVGRFDQLTAQVRVKLAQPVPEAVAAPVRWGTAGGSLVAILGGHPVPVVTGDAWPSANRLPVEGYRVKVFDLLGVPPTGPAYGPVFDNAGRWAGVAAGRFVGGPGMLIPAQDPRSCGALPPVPAQTQAQPAVPPAQPTISIRARGMTALAGASPTFSQRAADIIAARLRDCGALIRDGDTADLTVSVSITAQPGWMFAEVAVIRRTPGPDVTGYVQSKSYQLAGDASPTDAEITAAAGWLYEQITAGLCARR